MQLERICMYLQDISFKTEPSKDEGGDRARIGVMSFMLQPFTRDLAQKLGPGVVSHLFDRTSGDAIPDVIGMTLGIALPLSRVELRMATDTDPSVVLPDVKIDPRLAVRRDKETPTYSATLRLNFSLPKAKDLLFLVHALNTQLVVDIVEQQRELELAATDDEREPATRPRRRNGQAAATH